MMKFKYIFIFFLIFITSNLSGNSSYNSFGQTGLINIPSAETHKEQSIYFTFNRNGYTKLGTITATPFEWMEASYFYYRPDDLLWGGIKGLYLDKGFNVKFLYKTKPILLPDFAIGLDDFAGTGQFTKEYVVATYAFNNFKLTAGLGWGKFVGENEINNPLSIFGDQLDIRPQQSDNFNSGGSLSYDLWFRGDSTIFAGMEIIIPKIKNLSLKVESDPFDYFKFGCCGEGISDESRDIRKNDSDINIGLSYKLKDFGNIDISYINGNNWNLSLSFGFSSSKSLRKKNKFSPSIENTTYNLNPKDEFYFDVLENLNKNKLYLQTANIINDNLEITVDSEEHFNPIIYSSRSAYIARKVAERNDIEFKHISVGHISRGAQINNITFRSDDLNLKERYPDVLIKMRSEVNNVNPKSYTEHEFRPKVIFPTIKNTFSPDIQTHIGSPERFLYSGIGIKMVSEIQINREYVFYSSISKIIESNFDQKVSLPSSNMEKVRTQIVDYLQQSSEHIHITTMDLERVWSPYKNIYSKVTLGLLERMYGGFSSEIMYKSFDSNFALSVEFNKVKKRGYQQRFDFLEYETNTQHLNVAYYHPATNILAKWSYGTYLAKDKGYTLDLSRRMPSGWRAGFFFSRTNVSAELFGEGSFDKGFYFNIPLNVLSSDYRKDSNGFSFRTMTRDGGQKLDLRNRMIDSFYGSSKNEINENWSNYLD